jgi:glyoxylase-like metal-dependent hydrolase (beta-lactamase superfamily II)
MRFPLPALLCAVSCGGAAAQTAPPPQELAARVWLIPGTYPEGRMPDGNTVVFESDTGLVVMDTGRHDWHLRAILDFAAARKRPIVAIANSHWHLDHVSGNREIKRLFPQAKLYTGTAVERMVRDVFPQGIQRSEAFLATGKAPAGMAEDLRTDIETRRHPQALLPDVPIGASGMHDIDGLKLDIRLAAHAATEGDVWVYDPDSRIAAAGDLITFPVPFLDTACVKGWRAALNDLAATPFVAVVPGHGAAMDRPKFLAYKAAFEAYTDCIASPQDKAVCAAGWVKALPEAAADPRATEMAAAYVEFLRANGGNAPRCLAP